jgi:DNA invertase Pin-like site-specific DNA recombinase
MRRAAYMRSSSAANVGRDKDSEKRQRAAIEGYAQSAGYVIVEWFYDAAIKGAEAVTSRPGFSAMLDRIAGNGVRSIIVESPDRFARDLAVQLAGHDYLKGLGVALIPAGAPDFFLEDTPTAVLVRQVLGPIDQFDKATMVAKLRAARKRKAKGKVEGRKSYIEREGGPQLIAPRQGATGPTPTAIAARDCGRTRTQGQRYSEGPPLFRLRRPIDAQIRLSAMSRQ